MTGFVPNVWFGKSVRWLAKVGKGPLRIMHLTRAEPDANLHRFYRLEIVPGLFDDWVLVRNWGRIGSSGRLRTDWFCTEAEAKDARFELHMEKAKRGCE